MSEKNYYDILGVTKTASEDEIKKAYRKLVRQYHPDISTDPDADKKMGEINNAYETLKDSQKRQQYDLMLDNPFMGQGGGFGGFGNDPQMSQEELNDLLRRFGGAGFDSFSSHFGTRQEKNHNSNFSFDDIFQAFGGGRFQGSTAASKGEDKYSEIFIDIQKSYDGGSQQFRLQTPTDTLGNAYDSKTIEVKIPKGIVEGQKIRLAKQGNPSTSGGENGDLYLTIKFKEDEKFSVQGKDVTQMINVLPWEALFGSTITVTTPVGKVNVTIPKNSNHGTKLRLKGKGIPTNETGDLYLKLNIILPAFSGDEHRNEEQLQAWQFLQDVYHDFTPER